MIGQSLPVLGHPTVVTRSLPSRLTTPPVSRPKLVVLALMVVWKVPTDWAVKVSGCEALPGRVPVRVGPRAALGKVKEPAPAGVSSSRLEPLVITTAAPVSVPRCLKTEPPTLNAPRLDTVAPLLLTKPHSAVRVPPARTVTVPLFRNPLLLLPPPPGWQPPWSNVFPPRSVVPPVALATRTS